MEKDGVVEDVDLTVYVHVKQVGFFTRLKNAFLYIFGNKICFEEIILNEKKTIEIKSFLEEYLRHKGKTL